MNKPLVFILVMFLLLFSRMTYAGWPSTEKPPGAKLEPMGGEMNYNGHEMRSWVFHTPISVDRVLEFYRNRWSSYDLDETEVGPWQQISRKKGRYFITVQIQDGPMQGTIGRINMMDLNTLKKSHAKLGKGVPKLSGSIVMNDISSNDENKIARTVTLSNKHSIESNTAFYLNHYRADNWSVSENTPFTDIGRLIVLKKSADEITITISDTGEDTAILINKTKVHRWYH